MIILKGDVGKGRIIEKLHSNSQDGEMIIISVGKPELKYADYVTDDLNTLNELHEFVENTIDCKYIVVYTNYSEDVLQQYKTTIEELEYQYGIMCILTCKK